MPRSILSLLVAVLAMFRTGFAADDGAIRAEVEATLASISRAVIAGDQKAYLGHIDPDEPHFLAEQTHWSDELARYRPVEFTLAFGEGAAKFSDNAAEFPLVMSWRFEHGLQHNWGMDAKGRSVRFPIVRFTKKDGRWLYRGERWKEIAGPEGTFIVRFLEGSEAAAEDVIKAFPVARAHVDAEFQRVVKDRQTLILFKSMDHLKATVYLNMPDAVLGGWSEMGESIKFMDSYARNVAGWTTAYAHEYAHVATWNLGPGSRTMPWWVQEGVAELCAEKFRPGYALRLHADMKKRSDSGTLADWTKITDYLTTEPALKQLAYTQGDHMLKFITSRWKRDGRNAWLAAMGTGKSLDDATREALGLGFDELDGLWRKYVETKADEEDKPAVPEPAGLRGALEHVVKGMTAAVAAGDRNTYLSLVSSSDAVFFKEQQNWAMDLSRSVPESIEIALDESPLTLEEEGAAVGSITMNWRMPKGRDRTITFPARFEKGEAGWLYAGERWNVHKGENSLVLYEDEALKDVAALVADLLPEIRAKVDEGFEHSNNEAVTKFVQQVKLYTSMKHLQHSIYLSYTDGLSGWNEPGEAIKILASARSGKGMLRMLLSHEYGHVATFFLGPKATDMPWWILEGVAELSSAKMGRSSDRLDRMVRGWAKADKIIAWDKLADFRGEAVNHTLNVYNQGHHMVAFIETMFTRPRLNEWMTEMARGATLDDATKKVLGVSFEELDAKWRAALAAEKPPQRE